MKIKKFIEKAIEGGWNDKPYRVFLDRKDLDWAFNIKEVVLDPLAWQAVGKVEGWGTIPVFIKKVRCALCQGHGVLETKDGIIGDCKDCVGVGLMEVETKRRLGMDKWQVNMHRMIDALVEGKSLVEFIETL